MGEAGDFGVALATEFWSTFEYVAPQHRSYVASRLGSAFTAGELSAVVAMFGPRKLGTCRAAASWDSELGVLLFPESGDVANRTVKELLDLAARAPETPIALGSFSFVEEEPEAMEDDEPPVVGRGSVEVQEEIVQPGWCSKLLGSGLSESVGPWPTVGALLGAGYPRDLLASRLVEVSDGHYHVVPEGCAGSGVGLTQMELGAVVGADRTHFQPVFAQARGTLDPTVCSCKVHVAPRAALDGKLVGCCVKRAGWAGPIRAAAEGRHKFCAVDESVRWADWGFEQVVAAGPGSAGIATTLQESVRQYASVNSAVIEEFGRGYCYLGPVFPSIRWRSARVLGPNPLCVDIVRLYSHVIMGQMAMWKIEQVAPGWYHLTRDKSVKGVQGRAGEQLIVSLQAIVDQDPRARIGASVPGTCIGMIPSSDRGWRMAELYATAVGLRGSAAEVMGRPVVLVPAPITHVKPYFLGTEELYVVIAVSSRTGEVLGFIPGSGDMTSKGMFGVAAKLVCGKRAGMYTFMDAQDWYDSSAVSRAPKLYNPCHVVSALGHTGQWRDLTIGEFLGKL